MKITDEENEKILDAQVKLEVLAIQEKQEFVPYLDPTTLKPELRSIERLGADGYVWFKIDGRSEVFEASLRSGDFALLRSLLRQKASTKKGV